MDSQLSRSKEFYDREYRGDEYGGQESHVALAPALAEFVNANRLQSKRVVEFGCGRGVYQSLVADYTGIDLSESVRSLIRGSFVQASLTQLPIPDDEFDAGWSIFVLEHVPDPEAALREMRRVLRPGALLFLAPAWQCRPWVPDGYPVRPYRDFGLRGKLIKASIPIRESVLFRSTYIFPRRVLRSTLEFATRRPMTFRCAKIEPNYEKFWMPDSDAVNSMDPYEAIQWFRSRGDEVLFPGSKLRQFFVRNGHLIIRIVKR